VIQLWGQGIQGGGTRAVAYRFAVYAFFIMYVFILYFTRDVPLRDHFFSLETKAHVSQMSESSRSTDLGSVLDYNKWILDQDIKPNLRSALLRWDTW
jgi:hypothetical protein